MNKQTSLSAGRELKLIKIGNSTGVVLPKELLEKLRVSQGDSVYVTDSPDGVRLSTTDAAFQRRMDVAERIMREDRDILRVLAK